MAYPVDCPHGYDVCPECDAGKRPPWSPEPRVDVEAIVVGLKTAGRIAAGGGLDEGDFVALAAHFFRKARD